MATVSYPKISKSAWRTLRTRAANAPSTKFTPSSVAALLDMAGAKSASDNIVGPMRRLGLIAEDGSLTDRGQKWRVDESYGTACQEILDEIYPDDVKSLTTHDGAPEPSQVLTWFKHKGFGGSNASQMAGTFVMIASKELPDASADQKPAAKSNGKRPSAAPPRVAKAAAAPAAAHAAPAVVRETQAPAPKVPDGPRIHLDIQIHIPASATPEQIDRIFESMAKHLYAK